MSKTFSVGDKVKCLHPKIVLPEYKGEVGEVEVIEDFGNVLGIIFDDGVKQIAYVDKDGVVLVTEGVDYGSGDYSTKITGYYKGGELYVESVQQDSVNHPSHYGQGSIEAIEYIEDFLTEEEYVGYLRGNIGKYLHRWRYKNGVEDLKKAQWYLDKLIKTQESPQSE